ncbi:hypothetical protein JRO89_XS13G0125100 [Xanthoceras sorbifolium]|uniref:DUF4378 domain-containing protein n=1 Tax=Xanthoceras sorbifolium TaxID=99658 RepID=A0ABQ8H7Z4_9ROSI|nr:hypothetical protein JRO89_XS13G0125100 [Xanthoceras sorbifolium]
MGKHLQHEHSGVECEEYQPSCLGGIVHILDYHHRNNGKRMIQQKKHRGRRRAICCLNSKTISMDRDTGEVHSLLVAEAENFLVEQQAAKKSPINMSSGKPHKNTLISKEISTGENHKHWLLGFPSQRQLQRTNSIHHLEPSDYRLDKIDWTNPIIVLRKSADTSDSGLQVSSQEKRTRKQVEASLGQNQVFRKHKVLESSKNQKPMDAKHLTREILPHQVKEYVDILEIFKVNKELFLNILQDQEVCISEQVPGQQTSNTKAKLTKSVSFPVADMSRIRYLRPTTTLENKRNENWISRRGEKLVSGIQVPKLDEASSQEVYTAKKLPPLGDDNVGVTKKHKAIASSQESFQRSNHQWWNHFFIGRLRDIKQRIKHAIIESKKENNHPYTDGLVDGCTGSIDANEMPQSMENISMGQDGVENSKCFYETDGSDNDLSNSRLRRMRRTSSLNESLARYAQLFGSNFSGEAKLPHSKSLKLRNEDSISLRDRAPKFFRRISSLSDVESFYSLLNEVVHDSEMPVRTEVDCSTNTESDNHCQGKSSSFPVDTHKCEPSKAVVETEFQENMVQGSDSIVGTEYPGSLTVASIDEEIDRVGELVDYMVEPAKVASIPQQDQEIGYTTNLNLGLAQPSPVSEPETCFPDNTVDHGECPILEGLDSKTISVHISEAASSFDIHNMSSTYSLPGCLEKVNHEKDYSFMHFEMDIDDASFNYVRDVLELSGFIGNESLGAWYSLDQPLNPSLFKKLEGYLHHELQCSPEEVVGNCDHQLLFDLINETLLEIYERSFTYFPRAFSFNHHIRPMPKGHCVLEEVWSKICSYMSFRSEIDHSLDDIVVQDLAKRDSWMTRQFETECVALELEDLIFDELLDEVICSLDS